MAWFDVGHTTIELVHMSIPVSTEMGDYSWVCLLSI